MPGNPAVPGLTPLDHTADLGFEVEAPDFPTLLERAALGMDGLLREAPPPGPPHEERALDLDGGAEPALRLRALLRELLRWHERDGFAPAGLRSAEEAVEGAYRVRVHGAVVEARPVREIKGVTLHLLAAEPRDGRWWGRVVFDV